MHLLGLALTSVLVMAAPFVIIALWFFVRKHRKELKAMKKEIKSGDWARNFEHKINSKTQAYLDKQAKKQAKKLNKIEIKHQKTINKQELRHLKVFHDMVLNETIKLEIEEATNEQ